MSAKIKFILYTSVTCDEKLIEKRQLVNFTIILTYMGLI